MMKSKKSFKILISIILLFNYISFTSFTLNDKVNYKINNNYPQSVANYSKLKYSSSWTLSNIYINNNWSETANNYDWCNYENGSYIIENISIIGGVYAKNGIHIENTTDKFIIRNCQINEGVYLWDVNNGKLVNNNITFGRTYPLGVSYQIGVYMGRCNNISIKSNIINDTYNLTITLVFAICIYECNNIIVENNILSTYNLSQSQYLFSFGISCQRITEFSNIMIINNTIGNNGQGIDLIGNFYSIINNSIYNSSIGLAVYHDYTLISNNTIKNSYECGIRVFGSNHSIINNKLDENTIGIKCESGVSNSTISNNSIQNENDYGFYLKQSSYNIISNNTIQESKKYGIYLQSSNYNLITRNHITDVKGCIKENNCHDNIINNNICKKISNPIFGYFHWMVIGILIITTLLILKNKVKK